jgi:lysophospholipase L1-like esterase
MHGRRIAKTVIRSLSIAGLVLLPVVGTAPPRPLYARSSEGAAFKYDFGPGKIAPGYLQVLATSIYSEQSGFGFDSSSNLTMVDRDGKDALRSDFCTSDRPFFFTANLPEGNYDVTVTLGDLKDKSETTVKAESRRLMLEQVQTRPGEFAVRTFTVNVRNSRLKSGGQVSLKADEQPKLDWDDRLTLEFGGRRPCLCALTIRRAERAVTVFLAGDSTVTDQVKEPYCSWGQMLPRFFKAGVAIANHAESGEALKSFVGEKRLEKIMDLLRPGDYLFVQFAHNDQKKEGAYAAPFTDYKRYLKSYIAGARGRGAIPVMVSSMLRRRFDAEGKVINSLEEYPEAMRQTAAEEKVPLIDLFAMSKNFYEALGPEKCKRAFLHYPAGTFPEQPDELKDDTHFSAYGGYELAKCIVEGIRAGKLGLSKYLHKGLPGFDPGRPDSPDNWSLPVSPPQPVFRGDGR